MLLKGSGTDWEDDSVAAGGNKVKEAGKIKGRGKDNALVCGGK
jgi:hypothetical protein